MIRAPDIDYTFETPLIFVLMIGNVGGKIRCLTIIFYDHAIFFIAEIAGHKP